MNTFNSLCYGRAIELNTFKKGTLMNLTVVGYLLYLAIALPLTIWVAKELSRNGQVFLSDVFEDKHGLSSAVNKLLVVGFYLVNVGFVLLFLRSGPDVHGAQELVERLSVKLGIVLLSLGVLHLFNVMIFSSIRKGQHRQAQLSAQAEAQRAYTTALGAAR